MTIKWQWRTIFTQNRIIHVDAKCREIVVGGLYSSVLWNTEHRTSTAIRFIFVVIQCRNDKKQQRDNEGTHSSKFSRNSPSKVSGRRSNKVCDNRHTKYYGLLDYCVPKCICERMPVAKISIIRVLQNVQQTSKKAPRSNIDLDACLPSPTTNEMNRIRPIWHTWLCLRLSTTILPAFITTTKNWN